MIAIATRNLLHDKVKTAIPYVFTTHKKARQYTGVGAGFMKFIVVKAKMGTPLPALQQELQARMHDVDVFTSSQFSRRTTSVSGSARRA